jgi:hypothetical protein
MVDGHGVTTGRGRNLALAARKDWISSAKRA